MKVLIACNIDSYPNPYVKTLYNGLLRRDIDVTCSIKEFWLNATSYDIVHIQWPDLLVNKQDEKCANLLNVIQKLSQHNIPLLCTCHNLLPHYNSGQAIINTYTIVYNNCNYIQHLGEASIEMLKALYPQMKANHIVIPHHTYDELYDLTISKTEARSRLGIPKNVKCILSVGMFRHDEEREIVINLRKQFNDKVYYILAPGFFYAPIIRKNILLAIKALYLTIKYNLMAKYYDINISHKYLPDTVLPLYLKAADVMLIQRKKILNSGNVSLAMLAGLPIVGPNDGNVESLLRKTGNFIFDKNNIDDLHKAVKGALNSGNLGEQNYDYAMNNLTTSSVVDSIITFYQSCLIKK